MSKFTKFFVLSALTLTLAACGKTQDEKAQDRAQSLTSEQNALGNDLSSSEAPSESWSKQKLDAYEAKVNRLESVEAELDSMNGKNHIRVYGGKNTIFIAHARTALAVARLKKATG